MKTKILSILLFLTINLCFSQVKVDNLLNKNNVSQILRDGYVQSGNTFNKSNGDKIVFNYGETNWFGNDVKTFNELKSSINSSYCLITRGSQSTHQYVQYRKNGVNYIFITYNYPQPYKYTVTVFTHFGNDGE